MNIKEMNVEEMVKEAASNVMKDKIEDFNPDDLHINKLVSVHNESYFFKFKVNYKNENWIVRQTMFRMENPIISENEVKN